MFAQIPCMKFYGLYYILLGMATWLVPGYTAARTVPHTDHSVLASGSWYKLAIAREGIYKIDKTLLNSMGINTTAAIRLYGTGGRMLPEAVSSTRYDDLPEVALMAVDDYLLFYAPGPHSWNYQGSTYTHTLNLYSDTAYYYLQVGSGGKRIATDASTPTATITIQRFDYHDYYENDSLNLLQSGKQWWGPAFSSSQTTRTIPFTLPFTPTSFSINTRVGARSGGTSKFDIAINGNTAGSLTLGAITGNIFEAFATTTSGTFTATPSGAGVTINFTFTPGASGATGWLDYINLNARLPLQLPTNAPLFFRDANSIGQTARFLLQSASAQTSIWDITDPITPIQLATSLSGSTLSFTRASTSLHEYVAFDHQGILTPAYMGTVANQDLHGISGVNMLIITTGTLLTEAQRLAAWHTSHDGLSVQVVDVSQIYTEFASGSPDPTAVRDFIKMCYDRGGLQYVLLFGDASYDYKYRINGNTNLVPTWQTTISIDPIYAYPSDDFFGFLSDADDINDAGMANQMVVGVGRLPVKNTTEANVVVNKIINYHNASRFGRWQQHITFVADDGDSNLHLQDAESMSDITTQQWPAGNINKIYLDAYTKVPDAGGSRYPAVNTAIAEDIYDGTLIWNYTGHGNYSRLAEEVIMDASSLASWKNGTKLPLFITATCDFAPFDNPAYNSLGEQVLLQENGGGIALMTTTRAVFAASNKVLNANYLTKLLAPGIDGKMPTLGTAAMEAKNLTYSTYSDIPNNRKFQLLGDPALTLAFPSYRVVTDSLLDANGNVADTMKAMGKYTFKAHVEDAQGNTVTDYNGKMYTTVYDKPAEQYTLGNDAGSTKTSYYLRQHVLFSGQQTIKNGQISGTFIVPLDIDYTTGAGSISYFGTDSVTTAGGMYAAFQVTGSATETDTDTQGPTISGYLNGSGFVDGDITSENPVLYLQLYDLHGINTTGNGIGHDIVAILDEDNNQYYILNNFFEASPDSYQSGAITYPLYGLTAGSHTLTIKVWDTYNNSRTYTLRFKVVQSSQVLFQGAGCYPNPFHDQTSFTLEHNRQGEDLDVIIRIYTLAGQQIKTIRHTINAAGSRYLGANWDGRNDAGSKMPPGIYFYNIMVNANGKTKILGGKVILY